MSITVRCLLHTVGHAHCHAALGKRIPWTGVAKGSRLKAQGQGMQHEEVYFYCKPHASRHVNKCAHDVQDNSDTVCRIPSQPYMTAILCCCSRVETCSCTLFGYAIRLGFLPRSVWNKQTRIRSPSPQPFFFACPNFVTHPPARPCGTWRS